MSQQSPQPQKLEDEGNHLLVLIKEIHDLATHNTATTEFELAMKLDHIRSKAKFAMISYGTFLKVLRETLGIALQPKQ